MPIYKKHLLKKASGVRVSSMQQMYVPSIEEIDAKHWIVPVSRSTELEVNVVLHMI
jgi:hypothetical protein